MKRCSSSLIIKEMQIKLHWDITSQWSKCPSWKSLQITNAGGDLLKRVPSYIVGGNVNWYSHYGKQYEGCFFLEVPWKTKNKIAIWSCNPNPRHISRQYHNSKRDTHLYVHSSIIYDSLDMETTQFLLTNECIYVCVYICLCHIYTHNGILHKKWNNAICSNMGRFRYYHTKQK